MSTKAAFSKTIKKQKIENIFCASGDRTQDFYILMSLTYPNDYLALYKNTPKMIQSA